MHEPTLQAVPATGWWCLGYDYPPSAIPSGEVSAEHIHVGVYPVAAWVVSMGTDMEPYGIPLIPDPDSDWIEKPEFLHMRLIYDADGNPAEYLLTGKIPERVVTYARQYLARVERERAGRR